VATAQFEGQIRAVGLAGTATKTGVLEEARELSRALCAAGVSVRVEAGLAEACEGCQQGDSDFVASSDLVISLGGDGTFLGMARAAAPHGTPVLGLNLGSFGFLAEMAPRSVTQELEALLSGQFQVESRLMLEATWKDQGKTPRSHVALNDAVVAKGDLTLVRLELTADGELITGYEGDGVIVATPTGSTAYTLSAGGPIVEPTVQCLVITPICAHTLDSRPLVVGADVTLEVTLRHRPGAPPPMANVTLDGQIRGALRPDESVRVRRAPQPARLVRLRGTSFFGRLRTKMGWGTR